MTILGVKNISYTNKAGREVNGYELHVAYDDKRVFGKAVDTVFISQRVADDIGFKPEPKQNIEIFYNKYGSVADIKVL